MGIGPQANAVTLQHRAFIISRSAPQYGPYAQHKLTHAERLDHIVISPKAQAHHAIHLFTSGREHQHGDMGGFGLRTQKAADLKSVRAGHHDIQQQKSRQMLTGQSERLVAIGRLQNAETLTLQIKAQKLADIGFIFNYQYLLAHSAHLCDAARVKRFFAPM